MLALVACPRSRETRPSLILGESFPPHEKIATHRGLSWQSGIAKKAKSGLSRKAWMVALFVILSIPFMAAELHPQPPEDPRFTVEGNNNCCVMPGIPFTVTVYYSGTEPVTWWCAEKDYYSDLEFLEGYHNVQPVSSSSHHATWVFTPQFSYDSKRWIRYWLQCNVLWSIQRVQYFVLDPEPIRPRCRGELDPTEPWYGSFYKTQVDYFLPGRGLDMRFSRTYDSSSEDVPSDSDQRWRWPLGWG